MRTGCESFSCRIWCSFAGGAEGFSVQRRSGVSLGKFWRWLSQYVTVTGVWFGAAASALASARSRTFQEAHARHMW